MATEIKLEAVLITKRMYGWTKWGGRRFAAVQQALPEWACQACGEKQTRNLPAYLIPLDSDQREYVRVCAKCKYVSIHHECVVFPALIAIIRKNKLDQQ